MAQFPAIVELSTLDGSTGFQINGELLLDESGGSVAYGDVNGDGFSDLIIGADFSSSNGQQSGAAYVLFGKATPFAATVALSSLNGANGFQINGEAAYDFAGKPVASAGDVNGDGFMDLLVGGDGVDPNGTGSGATYVVFGRASGFGPTLALSSLDGSNGFQINGEAAQDHSGSAVAFADVNRDGYADLIVGARGADPNALAAGAAYVVFGKASGFSATLELSTLNGANGFQINGEAQGYDSGTAVSSAGDVNGDGFADLIIGAPGAGSGGFESGTAYVVFGKASAFGATFELSSLTGTNGFQLIAETAGDASGISVSGAGDVNADGFADLIVGASGAGPNGAGSGATYVVFGKASGFGATLALSSLNGSNGFQINGELPGDTASGFSVSAAGDVNGDGFGDILIGFSGADPNGSYSGASYVVFGKASGFSANLELSGLTGSNGFQINGEAASDHSGYSVSAAGDLNGDGFSDVIIGAYTSSAGAPLGGASYVVLGRKPDTAEIRTGTNIAQTLAGGDFADTLSALGGDDRLFGHGGDDTLNGGYGIDTAVFSGVRSDYTVAIDGSVSITGPAGSDVLYGIEKAKFDDQTVILGQGPRIFDFDRDLSADLLWQNESGQAAVWLMNGTTFTSGSGVGDNPGVTWHTKTAGDFDGNGHADILWQNDDGTVVIWFMDGTTVLGGGVAGGFNPGAVWQVKGTGDFNADDKADILWQHTDGTPAIWLMDGTTLLGGAAFENPGTSWHAIGSGDFNADHRSDILWQNESGHAAIWLMNGTTFVAGAGVGTNPGMAWHVKASGDFNADAMSDILWQNDNGTPVIWFMDGTNLVSGATAGFNPGSVWKAVGAGDFDGNGKADISWQHNDGTPAVWLMNGASLLSGAAFVNPGSTWHVLAMGS